MFWSKLGLKLRPSFVVELVDRFERTIVNDYRYEAGFVAIVARLSIPRSTPA
jgi:hypothetical protein